MPAPAGDSPIAFEGFPFIVGWELTLACNLRCSHCGSSAGAPRSAELTTGEALALCDQLPALLVQEVDFTGGEPLLRSDWQVIAGHLADLGIPANVLTNGLVLGREKVAELKRAGISGVGVSLDGLEEAHDAVRGHGSFRSVLRALGLLQDAGIPFNVITTVNARNLAQLSSLHGLLDSLGVEAWRLQPLIPMGRAADHSALALNRDAILRLGHFIREAQRQGSGGVRILCSDGLEYVNTEGDRPWRGCSAGIIACGITSDGRVKGCLSMPDELVEGNLREDDLWDIWFRPGAFAYTRAFQLEQLGPSCRSCEKGPECRGGCSSSSYTESGRFHDDPACFLAAERACAAQGKAAPAADRAHVVEPTS